MFESFCSASKIHDLAATLQGLRAKRCATSFAAAAKLSGTSLTCSCASDPGVAVSNGYGNSVWVRHQSNFQPGYRSLIDGSSTYGQL